MHPRRFIRPSAWLLALCLLLTGCRPHAAPVQTASGVEFLMNTFVEQRWYGPRAQEAYDAILQALHRLEQTRSIYVEDSEISCLNAAAGKETLALSDEAYALLRRMVTFGDESGGRFDVTIAPLTLVWGITEPQPKVPSPEAIETARALVNYRDILFDDANKTVMLAREDMRIDLGGVVKGMAAGEMRAIAKQYGVQGYLSLGGNMMVEGKKPDGSDFRIGIRDPFGNQSQYMASLTLDGLTMATAGDYERYFEEDGVRYHHILDPFTGYPSNTDLTAVTVISADGTLADCLSTSIFLMGTQGLAPYLAREDCMVFAVTKDRQVYASPGLWERLDLTAGENTYTFHREGLL